MNKETRLFFGKILGEIYKIQNSLNNVVCEAGDAHIYALLNGFESAIDDELKNMGSISTKQLSTVISVLVPIYEDTTKTANFRGFYDIEDALNSQGVDRGDAIIILTYLKAKNKFTSIIEKMDSSHSPSECRTFEI